MSLRHAARRLSSLSAARASLVLDGAAPSAPVAAALAAARRSIPPRPGAPPWTSPAPARRRFGAKSDAGGDTPSAGASAKAGPPSGSSPADAASSSTSQSDAANPMANIMFPWERAVLSGDRSVGPMSGMQKLYWGAFALAVAFLVANRAREYYASLKSKEEMAAELAENRRAMQAALDGESFADADDPFEGMEPREIEAFLKKQAPDGDPYAGMSPEEINAHLHATQERTVRENLSFPKNLPGAGR